MQEGRGAERRYENKKKNIRQKNIIQRKISAAVEQVITDSIGSNGEYKRASER